MEFIGITALVDAVIALVALAILRARRGKLAMQEGTSKRVMYFTKYLLYTFVFLVVLGLTILTQQGQAMMAGVFVADLVLWVSLAYIIAFAFVGKSTSTRNLVVILFFIIGLSRSAWQIAGLMGMEVTLGETLTYMLSNLDAWLMYAVWVPIAFYFILVGLGTQSSLVRMRSLMFAVGLLLITFTWAFRLLSANPTFMTVSVVSVIGFALLLGGVLYRGQEAPAPVYS